jgi:hypothetical protein
MDLLAGEPQFASDSVMFDFPAAGQTPQGAHIDGEKRSNLFRCEKRAFQCPVDACHMRHGRHMDVFEKLRKESRRKFFVVKVSLRDTETIKIVTIQIRHR